MVGPLYTTEFGLLFHAGKILVLTVGLPARGKTHTSRALERYLPWAGVKIMVVSLGDYRRKILGSAGKLPSDYFTPNPPREDILLIHGRNPGVITRSSSNVTSGVSRYLPRIGPLIWGANLVQTQAYHFWDGDNCDANGAPGARYKDESNFYENYAEDARKPRSPLALHWEPAQLQGLPSEHLTVPK